MNQMKRILAKRRAGQKLTGAENVLWEATVRLHLLKQRETSEVTPDGTVVIRRTMDAEPVMDGVRMMSESQLHSPVRDSQGRTYLGSIDPITAVNWAKECGHPLYSKEWREYAKKKLMSGDFSKFRADRVKRYI